VSNNATVIGGELTNRPQHNQCPNLQYRDGRQDIRPKSEGDFGCAVVFAFIAIATLLGIAAIVRFDLRRNGISLRSIIAIVGLALFAAGSIIAVCGRLTRYRWWAHTNWNKSWPGRDQRNDGV